MRYLVILALCMLAASFIIEAAATPCECDTDSDCMARCGGDGSPDVK